MVLSRSQVIRIWAMLLVMALFSACSTAQKVEPTLVPEGAGQAAATHALAVEKETQPTAVTRAEERSLPDGDAAGATRIPADKYRELEIVTLLPRDAIPAIDDPQFLGAAEADTYYDADELVIGVEFGGEARAYSVPLLSNHEIVNDTVGGVKIAVTW